MLACPHNIMVEFEPDCDIPAAIKQAILSIAKTTTPQSANKPIIIKIGQASMNIYDPNAPKEIGEICLSFLDNKHNYLAKSLHEHPGLLASAIGWQRQKPPTVLDCTAGFGKDAFVLLNLGCHVTALEKHPVLAIWLKFGFWQLSKTLAPCPNFIFQNALDYLTSIPRHKFDVIYLDPMFEQKPKSAKANKNLQLLQHWHANEPTDTNEILLAAMQKAKRVVIKLPSKINFALITENTNDVIKPASIYSGKGFDILTFITP